MARCFFNLRDKNLLLTGYGYTEKIPEMTLSHRQGSDGSNENVHNFIVNIIARGGHISYPIYYFLILLGINLERRQQRQSYIHVYLSVLQSFFDATNESVRYPFIFYTFLGYFLNNLDKTYKFKLSKQIY